jgi:hypothetical protein
MVVPTRAGEVSCKERKDGMSALTLELCCYHLHLSIRNNISTVSTWLGTLQCKMYHFVDKGYILSNVIMGLWEQS